MACALPVSRTASRLGLNLVGESLKSNKTIHPLFTEAGPSLQKPGFQCIIPQPIFYPMIAVGNNSSSLEGFHWRRT